MKTSCLFGILAVLVLAPFAVCGQDQSSLVSSVEGLRFPLLARQARIQGDVRLHAGSDGITVVNGHPLLDRTAIANLKELSKFSKIEGDLTYHFVFVSDIETRVTRTTVKKGNRFERFFRHVFMMRTEEVVEGYECIEHPIQRKNRIDLTTNPIDVWIYAWVPCVQTSTSQIALY
jgi:hypothetical protein